MVESQQQSASSLAIRQLCLRCVTDPEFDIDRTYELINEKRGRIQHHPHQQLVATESNDGDDDVDRASRLGGGTQLLDQPAAATDGRPVAGIPPAHATTAARNVTKTGTSTRQTEVGDSERGRHRNRTIGRGQCTWKN